MISPTNIKTYICSFTIVGSILLYFLFRKKSGDNLTGTRIKTSRQSRVEIKIPNSYVGSLIGRNGNYVKEIQQTTQTKIFFESSLQDEEFRTCVIRGREGNIALAESIIRNIISSQPALETYEMLVPEHFMGKLMGISGCNIRRIQKLSKATVKIDRDNSGTSKIFKITGTGEQILNCQQMIQEIIDEEYNPEEFSDDLKEYFIEKKSQKKQNDLYKNDVPEIMINEA